MTDFNLVTAILWVVLIGLFLYSFKPGPKFWDRSWEEHRARRQAKRDWLYWEDPHRTPFWKRHALKKGKTWSR